jgi:hypothetical protein
MGAAQVAMLRYVGLIQPYRFERAIPAFVALILLLATLVTALGLTLFDSLPWRTARAGYVVYLVVLCLLAWALLRWPRIAGSLVLLAIAEFTLGIGSMALKAVNVVPATLMPSKIDRRFDWHILLQVVPRPAYAYAVGIDVRHNSLGLRGRERTAEELKKAKVVAIFGGSSTYDVGNPEGKTWPEQVERALGPEFAVLNHGVPGFTSVQHLLQTAFYEDKHGVAPRCAVYYVGWNDIRNAHIANLDPAYADFYMPALADSLRTRRVDAHPFTFSPLINLVLRLVAMAVDTVPFASVPAAPTRTGSDATLERYYESNIRAISAINRARGIRTVWISQILNREGLDNDAMYGGFPYVLNRHIWPLQERFNEVLRATAQSLDDPYTDVPVRAFVNADFLDEGHFVATGAAKFAGFVAPDIARHCR